MLTAAPQPSPSPFSGAYARLSAACPGLLRVTEEPPHRGPGWVTARQLAGGGTALARFLAEYDAQVLRDHGRRARPDAVAAFGFHGYVWPACLLFTVPWFLHRRVPLLPADAVSFHRARGRLTVLTGRFGCLRDDPAAALPHAIPVADEDRLRRWLRAAVAAHLAPVLAGFRPRMRRGPHALWGLVVDEITEGLWYVGQLLGEEDRAVAELGALLPSGTPPLSGGAGFRRLAVPGGSSLRTRDRVACCLHYTVRPDQTCVTCPRTGDADRIRRLTPAG